MALAETADLMTSLVVDGAEDESRIRREFTVFQDLVGVAEDCLTASRLRAASACAEIAAASAWRNHAGLFASPRLERLLIDVGRRAVPASPNASRRTRRVSPERVLHVMSKARAMGGDSRFACRWMQADGTRQHSVAITTQLDEAIPEDFIDSASRTGGHVHCLDADTRDPILRARRLRSLVENVDLVALHLYPDDIVPLLAFADKDGLPPVVFINHSDHTFWLGVTVGDIVVHLRRSGVSLSVRRRHIEADRLALLPIPLSPAERTLSRADAKKQLGLSPGSVVLLSVGTEFKYAPVAGPGFLEVLLPIITKHNEAVLLAVGPRNRGEWAAAHEKTGGRIAALGRRYDTAMLFQAADVYLDQFPCTSPTAALEAGSYGLPLITYSTHSGDARVFSPGAPGLDESVCQLDDVRAYTAAVSRLILEPDFRRELGERARRLIDHHHQGAEWLARLGDIYRMAATTTAPGVQTGSDHCEADRVDVMISRLYRVDRDGLGRIIDEHVRSLPLTSRVTILRKLLSVNRSFSFDLFLPGWLARRLTCRPPYWGPIRRWMAGHRIKPRHIDPCAST